SNHSLPLRFQNSNQKWFSYKPIEEKPKKNRLYKRNVDFTWFRSIMDQIQVPVPSPQPFLRPVLPPGRFELLPDDIFHLFLPYLPNEDRLSLSLTCKRMRRMERTVGRWKINQFENVHAHSSRDDDDKYEIEVSRIPTPQDFSTFHSLVGSTRKGKKRFYKTIRHAGIFQRANINHLQITDNSIAIDSLRFIFSFTPIKKFTFKVKNARDDDLMKSV
ncbi:hypothetical protein PMAYCL1PPCAC_11657, partial [Pristionchus mayeri]